MGLVTLSRTPNQSFALTVAGRRFDVRIFDLGDRMAADVAINGTPILSAQRLVAGAPLIPYRYLEAGNLILVTGGEEPDWRLFGISQTLVTLDDAGDPVASVIPGGSGGGGGGPGPAPQPNIYLERAKNLADLTDTAAARVALDVLSAAEVAIIVAAIEATLADKADLSDIPVKATGDELRALTNDDKFLTPKSVADAAALVALTDAATIVVDLSAGVNFAVTLGGNRTLGAPTNAKPGTTFTILIKQPASGGPRTLAYASEWKSFGAVPAVSTAANAVDLLTGIVETSGSIRFALQKGGAA